MKKFQIGDPIHQGHDFLARFETRVFDSDSDFLLDGQMFNTTKLMTYYLIEP